MKKVKLVLSVLCLGLLMALPVDFQVTDSHPESIQNQPVETMTVETDLFTISLNEAEARCRARVRFIRRCIKRGNKPSTCRERANRRKFNCR